VGSILLDSERTIKYTVKLASHKKLTTETTVNIDLSQPLDTGCSLFLKRLCYPIPTLVPSFYMLPSLHCPLNLNEPTHHATLLHFHPYIVIFLPLLRFVPCASHFMANCCISLPPLNMTVKVVTKCPCHHCCHPGCCCLPLVVAIAVSIILA